MKRLAIVGSHPDTRDNAPWDNVGYDIWVFNEAPNNPQPFVKRWDVCFQLHHPSVYTNPNNRTDPGHWAWLKAENNPQHIIYMQDVDPRVPCSKRYPLEAIDDLLWGFSFKRYLETSVSYAIALAILEGYKQIDIYGVEMASNTEYIHQRANVGFWIGFALGRGIEITMHCAEEMFEKPLYGYEGNCQVTPDYFKANIAALKEQLTEKLKAKQEAEQEAVVDLTPDSLKKQVKACIEYGAILGALEEERRYLWKVEAMIVESGTAIIDNGEYENSARLAGIELQKYQNELLSTSGVIDYAMAAWLKTHDPNARKLLDAYILKHLQAAIQFGTTRGIMLENNHLLDGVNGDACFSSSLGMPDRVLSTRSGSPKKG